MKESSEEMFEFVSRCLSLTGLAKSRAESMARLL
ncbi:hypothetical protein FHS27_003701 [Rhodopirellula rubra]|uniref:Uncharacterized protein n=1 Tax=Aporhodopirellula rubra TaxID=980271 RepID=A0A7W5E166_9BACT|nr:hypothetical protein [Aporhodopirellula rubra]